MTPGGPACGRPRARAARPGPPHGSALAPRFAGIVGAALLGAACAATVEIEELDSLIRSSEARTILLEPGFSLYSPFAHVPTRDYLALVEEERGLVARLFGPGSLDGVVVWLVPVEGLQPGVTIEDDAIRFGPRSAPAPRVLGISGGRTVVVRVEPPSTLEISDGRRIEGNWAAETYREVLRHELAHVAAHAAGIDGETWLDEGLAHAVELARVEGGELVVDARAAPIAGAADVPRGQRALAPVLDYAEDLATIERGGELAHPHGRQLATSFFVHLLARRGEGSFAEKARAIAQMSRAELLAEEGEWQEALDAGRRP